MLLGYTLDPHKKAILDRIERLKDPKQKQVAMTAAQYLEQKGRQEGMKEEKIHIAKNMLHSNEPKEKIHQFTGLSWVEIEALIREQKAAKK